MDYLAIIVAIVAYFAVLAIGIACVWLVHRRAAARARKAHEQWAHAAAGMSAAMTRSSA